MKKIATSTTKSVFTRILIKSPIISQDASANNSSQYFQTQNRTSVSAQLSQYIEAFKDKFDGGSLTGSMFTLIMATFGSGILVLPSSIASSGLIWGIIQLFFCSWISYYSLMTMVICAKKAKACSYQELAAVTYGQGFRWVINIVFFFASWGTVMLYLKLITSICKSFILAFVKDATPDTWPNADIIIICAISTFFVLPLSLTKELKQLRYLCLMSFCFVVFLCFAVFGEFFGSPPIIDPTKEIELFIPIGIYTTFPTAIFAFMSHPNILDIWGELRNPQRRRMRRVVSGAIVIVLVCSVFISAFGYVTFVKAQEIFGEAEVSGVIILAYSYDSGVNFVVPPVVIRISLILISIALTVVTPINVIPTRDAITDFFIKRVSDRYGEPVKTMQPPRWAHITLVCAIVYSAMGVAMLDANIQKLMNVIGSSFYILICFIFPAIFYLKIEEDKPRFKLRKILNFFILVGMSGMGVWMTIQNVKALVE